MSLEAPGTQGSGCRVWVLGFRVLFGMLEPQTPNPKPSTPLRLGTARTGIAQQRLGGPDRHRRHTGLF